MQLFKKARIWCENIFKIFSLLQPQPSDKFKISSIYIFQNYLYTNIAWEKDTEIFKKSF